MRRRDKRKWYLVGAMFVAVFLFVFLKQNASYEETQVEAASLKNFDAGMIISDYQMGNYQSMTVKEIQEFLTAKNSCGNTDEELYKNLSEAHPNITWHFEDGHFVCMSEELFGDGVAYGKDLKKGEGETAAQIIWQAAQDYKINPQVLLVLLQKESSLVTDKIPNSSDYRKATGYGCPDNAPCSEKYYGFKNQIRKAAELFSEVLNGGWTNFPLGKNYIQYNPSVSCGGSVVEIKNLATSALYRYTPYQPNEAAIKAGYGTAECGAYGNRNFYLYFEDWFGGILDEKPAEEKASDGKAEVKGVTSSNNIVIEDGVYQLVSKAQKKVIDIEGGVFDGMKSGEILLFRDKEKISQIENQVFEVKYNAETGYYNIINPTTGLLMDVFNANKNDNTPVIMWVANGGCNQDWSFVKDGEGYYTVTSRCSKKALSATADDVVIYKADKSDRQKWELVPTQTEANAVENGVYQIVNVNNLALDVYGGITDKMKEGELVEFKAKEKNDTTLDNQLFSVKFDINTQNYVLRNQKTGLIVKSAERGVVLGDDVETCEARWVFVKVDGGYAIMSACGGAIAASEESLGGSKRVTAKEVGEEKWNLVSYGGAAVVKEGVKYQITIDENAVDIYGGVQSGMTRGELIKFGKKQKGWENQAFIFKYNIEADNYYIYNPATKTYLDVAEAKTTNDAEVITFSYNGNCNQQWKVEKIDGKYKISSACSGKGLAFSGSKKMDGYPRLVINSNKAVWNLVEIK